MRKLRIRLLAVLGAAGCALVLTTAPAGAQELPPLPVPTPPLPVPDLPVPPAPPVPVPDGPLVDVSPDVAVGVCGNGVTVAGTGTTSDCSGQQSSTSSDGSALINADPAVQAGVCGNGVAVAGLGTSSDCTAQQEVAAGGDSDGGTDGIADVDPTVQAAVCGNGVSLAGTGTTAVCGAQATGDPGPDGPDGPDDGVGSGVEAVLTGLDAPAGDPGDNGASTLPITGFEPVLMALAGLALTSVGGATRLRVLGS